MAQQNYPIHQTQHIDSLASPGILFNAMHSASPVCTPTRASILTGRLPGREKIDYVDDTGKNQMQASAWEDVAGFAGGHTEGDSESSYCIPQQQYTIAHAARKKGYATAFYGKWHLGNLHNSKTFSKYDNTPIDYGFQRCDPRRNN
jgi:arylsulfatase A-like enzyme